MSGAAGAGVGALVPTQGAAAGGIVAVTGADAGLLGAHASRRAGRAAAGNLVVTTVNVGTIAEQAHDGSFCWQLRDCVLKLCEGSHVVGIQGVRDSDSWWLRWFLPVGWAFAGDTAQGIHVLWDQRQLALQQFQVSQVFPETDKDDRYRKWRKYLEAHPGQATKHSRSWRCGGHVGPTWWQLALPVGPGGRPHAAM